jgi:hypothetical protein
MRRFSSRDVKIFLLGMLTMFLILIIYEWKDFVAGFKDGFNGRPFSTESTK